MSENGAYRDDMGRFSRIDDRELDRVFAGEQVPGNEELDELAAFVRATQVTFSEAPGEHTETRHLQAMMAEASRASDTLSPAEEPASEATPRSKPMTPFASLTAKLVLAGVLALGAFAGAASAGVLPSGIQGSTADIAKNVGIDLPDGDDGQENNVDDGDVNNTDDGQVGNVDDGQQGNVDDRQQGNVDDGDQNNVDDGAQGDVDDGHQGDTDDGPQGDTDDGPQGDTDDGAQGNTDDGPQGNTDDGRQGDHQGEGGQGSGGSGQGGGSQGNGNN